VPRGDGGAEGCRGGAVGHQEPWGVRETDERTGELVALEFWNAARQLPAALLDALPAPRTHQPV
jgi:hypothetical protein